MERLGAWVLAAILWGHATPLHAAPLHAAPSQVTSPQAASSQVTSAIAQPEAKPQANSNTALGHETIIAIDWQPLHLIPRDRRGPNCELCQGQYIDPLSGTVINPDAPVNASASSGISEGAVLQLKGDAVLEKGGRTLNADNMTYDREGQTVTATGNILMREPGFVIAGERANYNVANGTASIESAYFTLHEEGVTGSAAILNRDDTASLSISNGALSYCPPEDPFWYITSNEITIDQTSGIGEAFDTVLTIKGVPIIYLPWVQFPIDDRRKTGLLFPEIATGSRGGLDIAQPIYLNLAPNYDATYTPRYIAKRGFGQQLEGRYLDDSAGYWQTVLGYFHKDDEYEKTTGIDKARWTVGVEQTGSYGEGWYSRIDYQRVSDRDYLRDINNNNLSALRQSALLQYGELGYVGRQWRASVEVQQFQSLATDIDPGYRKQPQIDVAWQGDSTWLGVQPLFSAQYSRFDARDKPAAGRLFAEVGLSYPIVRSYGYLKSRVKYRHLDYDIQDAPSAFRNNISLGSGVFSLDGALTFERTLRMAGTSLIQTLEPRIFYLYSEYEDQTGNPVFDGANLTFSYQQLFRETRFAGHDRLDDANQLSLGLTTRLIDAGSGRELLSASVGQIAYFDDRRVDLYRPALVGERSRSALAGELEWQYSSALSLRSSMLFDHHRDRFDAATLQVSYHGDQQTAVNVGYTLRRSPQDLVDAALTEQASLSAYYPISSSWKTFGALEYSLVSSELVQGTFGFEYEDCCWQLRALFMRYADSITNPTAVTNTTPIDYQNSVQFQFVLKGLGGAGSRIDELLTDIIRGFTGSRR